MWYSSILKAVAPLKALSRRGRVDRAVVLEEDNEEDDEPEEEEVSSSGETEIKGKEIKKEGKKEKEESWDFKETKEAKEKKETKPLEVVNKQEEIMEKVTHSFSSMDHSLRLWNI